MNAWWKSHTNTYFTIQCVCMLVPESCLTLCNPMDCSLLGSSVHVILQARILEWVTISFSTSPNLGIKLGSPALRTDFFIIWATIQFSSVMCDPMDCQAPLSITNSQSLLKLTFIVSVMPSNHLILRCPLLLPPSIFPSIRVFSNESVLHIRCPKCWSFSFNISPSKEHSGLISFRMDWLDLLAVQGTLKSLFHTTI